MKRVLQAVEPALPHEIRPNAVYFLDQAQAILRLRKSSIRREVRLGRLQIARRCGRHYLLGSWILSWIASGVIQRGLAANGEGQRTTM